MKSCISDISDINKLSEYLVSIVEILYCHPELDSGLIYIDSKIEDPEFNSGSVSAPLLSC